MRIEVDPEALRPLITAIAEELLEQLAEVEQKLPGDRFAYPEGEAAQRLGIPQHVLRDARLRGEIHGRRVGKRILYARDTLIAFVSK